MIKKERIRNLNKIKIKQNFLQIILSLIFVYLIFYVSGYFTIFKNDDFYKKEFEKYKIFQQFPKDDIFKINEEVITYLNPGNYHNSLNTNFFNKNEKDHLEDVKYVFLFLKNLYVNFFFLLLFFQFFLLKENFIYKYLKSIFYGSIISLSIIFVLFIGIFLNFDYLFSGMHHIFFEPGTWTFDPSESNMINLYPIEFFMDFGLEIGKKIIVVSLFLFFISLFAIKVLKRK